jgi:hypothetical protein
MNSIHSTIKHEMLNTETIVNPFLLRDDNMRDPAVYANPDGGYHIFYTRVTNDNPSGEAWACFQNWHVARVFTRDFKEFSDDRVIFANGFASPGDLVCWHGRLLLPFQSYPVQPNRLCYAVGSEDAKSWGEPIFFLDEARALKWNLDGRLIDPSFVVCGDTLHCFFVGSQGIVSGTRANLLGHATTRDPELLTWTIHSVEDPLMGISPEAPDGVENVMVFPRGAEWTMIFSEGLQAQHLAWASSPDLYRWKREGLISIPRQAWMARKFGAPFVWQEDGRWFMILMGEEQGASPDLIRNGTYATRFGLLHSCDGLNWSICPERS